MAASTELPSIVGLLFVGRDCDNRGFFTVFQAFKFMDTSPALAERIRMVPTARMAQQEAKKQIRFQRADWLEVNVAVMEKVLEAKFKQHRHLRNLLRSTGSRELIEDSPVGS